MPQMCPNCSRDNPDYAQTCAYCGEVLRGLLGCNTILEGRYRVTHVLGCGGMGAVYLADDIRIQGRRVAVKENLNTTLQSQAQFQYEVSLMVRLNHPGLPDVSDQFVEPGGRQYMVMDYVEGETLEDIVDRRGPLPEAEVIALADQLLDVLEHLHSHSVIHRDVKPANVKITPGGKPVLVDFGIAKLHAPGHRTQIWARGFGSPGFAPLEQYGQGRTDARSDLYSLGAMIYFLLTGQAPPESPYLAAGTPLTPPRQLQPALSPHVQSVIFKAMALDPAQRYQSAAEMRQALLMPAGPMVTPAQPLGAKPLLWGGIGFVGIVVSCLVIVGLVLLVLAGALWNALRGTWIIPPMPSIPAPPPTLLKRMPTIITLVTIICTVVFLGRRWLIGLTGPRQMPSMPYPSVARTGARLSLNPPVLNFGVMFGGRNRWQSLTVRTQNVLQDIEFLMEQGISWARVLPHVFRCEPGETHVVSVRVEAPRLTKRQTHKTFQGTLIVKTSGQDAIPIRVQVESLFGLRLALVHLLNALVGCLLGAIAIGAIGNLALWLIEQATSIELLVVGTIAGGIVYVVAGMKVQDTLNLALSLILWTSGGVLAGAIAGGLLGIIAGALLGNLAWAAVGAGSGLLIGETIAILYIVTHPLAWRK